MSRTKIIVDDKTLYCQQDESLLDALLRKNIDVPHSCKQGICQSCLVRSEDGEPPANAQQGLKEQVRRRHFFLACLCRPQHDMRISLHDKPFGFTEATVIEKQPLNADIVSLTIECCDMPDYFAGQFVQLKRRDGLTRSYSIVNSRVQQQKLSFHIRRLNGGRFSEWVHRELTVGDTLAVSKPQGDCYYSPEQTQQNMLLIGTGSGLAPLAGIVNEALQHGHRGQIHLFHGSREIDGLYWIDEMRQLAERYPQFHYRPCVSSGPAPDGVAAGRAHDVAMANLPDLQAWRVYLCGHPDMVGAAKRQAYLKGARFQDILADAFHVAAISG